MVGEAQGRFPRRGSRGASGELAELSPLSLPPAPPAHVPSDSVSASSTQPIGAWADLSCSPHPPAGEGWSRACRRGKSRFLGAGLSPHPPTLRDKINNRSKGRVAAFRGCFYISVTLHRKARSGGGRGVRASEELQGVPSCRLGEPGGCSNHHMGNYSKDPLWGPAAATPPQLRRRPSPAPPQTCRRGTGYSCVAPEVLRVGRGGARAEQAEPRPAESDAPGVKEAAAVASPPRATPDRDAAETPIGSRFFQGIF